MRNILSRRQFFGAVGATLGFASLGTLNSLAFSIENQSAGNLGLILPESRLYPRLATELIDGIVQNLPGAYKVSRLEATTLENLKTFSKASDTIISYASPSSGYALRKQLIEDTNRVIAADLGMDIQRFSENLPHLNYISLNYWQLAQALALWVKQEFGQRLLIVADSYESGYDSFSLFESNFPEAKIVLYKSESLASFLHEENFDAIAFALSGENAEKFIAEYEAQGLRLPLVRLPFVGDTSLSSKPIYSASFAFDSSPFYTLGQRIASVLQGKVHDEARILIKQANQPIAQYTGSQLPYHGISTLLKTGWTNPYPL